MVVMPMDLVPNSPRRTPGRPLFILLATDRSRSVLSARRADVRRDRYSAYGFRALLSPVSSSGFNGECHERYGVYLLGSYRAYSPLLMRFYRPDSLSPFGRGGLNAYAYCLGDPVNRRDPTGHVPWWVGMLVGVATTAWAAPLGALVLPASTQLTVISSAVATVAGGMSFATGLAATMVEPGMARDMLGALSLGAGIAGGVAGGVALRTHAAKLARGLSRRGGPRGATDVPVEMVQRPPTPVVGGPDAVVDAAAQHLQRKIDSALDELNVMSRQAALSSRVYTRSLAQSRLEDLREKVRLAQEDLDRHLNGLPPRYVRENSAGSATGIRVRRGRSV